MDFDALLNHARGWSVEFSWVLQAFGVVLATLILGSIARRVLVRVLERARSTENYIDDVLFESLVGPTRGLIWVVGIAFAAHIVGQQTDAPIFDAVNTLRIIGIVAMITWFMVRFVRLYEARYLERRALDGKPVDRTFVQAVGKLVRAAAIITSGLIVLQTLGIKIAGLLAFGGVGGIAVGLAARDIMANVFGGLTNYLDRPFAVGDWIRSPDQEIE
ncbi:MAG TPA: mechanosensitive ion channel domain-containing protein, partial [Steroidobacteraceae bacterium]|nr:mechanosensitive ion channel domain-containing protein [Steroidobacteraceae bacterium]